MSSTMRPSLSAPAQPRCNYGRLLNVMDQRRLDGLVIYLRPNVYYLSGYTSKASASVHETNGYGCVLVARHEPDHPILIVPDFDLATLLHRPTWIEDVRAYANLLLPLDEPVDDAAFHRFVPRDVSVTSWGDRARARYASSMDHAVTKALGELGLMAGRIGCDDLRFGGGVLSDAVELVDAYGLMKYVRQVKTAEELELLTMAAHLNEQALTATLADWDPEASWKDVNHLYHQKVLGLGGFVHDPGGVVVANPRGSDPAFHMDSGVEDFPIVPGMNIMFDCHGTIENYCWDGGKTWLVGGPRDRNIERIAGASANAMEEVRTNMRPGVGILELQRRARRVYEQSGVSRPESTLTFFHGLGLEHVDAELPPGRSDWKVEEGMVISTHLLYPGGDTERYFLEDIMYVTGDGGERLFSWNLEPFIT